MTPNSPPQFPSVAIIVRVMDRAEELRLSLPSLLHQDYSDYHVVIVDHSSQDGLTALLENAKSPRLRVIRCPRPSFFNRSSSGNIGARYSFSDLLFFLDTGVTFRDERHLAEIVAAFERSTEIDDRYYERWRQAGGYPSLETSHSLGEEPGRRVYCECECHGLHMLVSRDIFQTIGGLNEALLDWGYEDTDLTTRLELCGYGRIPIRGLLESQHDDELRLRFHREKSKERSWAKNRRISDGFIRTFGPILRTQRTPGLCDWVEIDGLRYAGTDAPQQEWTVAAVAELPEQHTSTRHSLGRGARAEAPFVSVVVPTKNAAEYLVGVLDSILSQDYPNVECLVIDGGSTDATLDILANYGDQIMWTTQPDRGAFDAINRGWQTSRGQVLAWLNADDSWTPRAVSAAIKCFQDDPDADLVYGDCLIVDAEGRELERRRPPDWDLAYAVESCHHIIDQPSAFIRRSMVERVGWLYPAWFHDWDLWRRISLAGGKIKRVPHLLGCARVRVDNSQYKPDILVNGLVELTKRFFSLPGLPSDILELRRRALSNCYLKIVQTLQYGRPDSRALRLSLCLRALAADPSNLRNVLKTNPGGRRALPTSEREENLEKMKPPTQCSLTFATVQAMEEKPILISNVQDRPEPSTVISVVVPCKNDARYLPSALESILSQDYPHLECIVMDGGSTDGTLNLLERYGDRIRWQSEPDRGAFDAINRGWQLSKGEILTWLNADDLWVPGALRTAVEVFEGKPEVDVVFGTAGVIDELGRVHGDLVPDSWDLERALREGFHIIFQPASFMRRRILEEVGWLYPAWCHDHDLWLRIARAGGIFEKIPVRLAMDRLRTENLGQLADLVVPAKIGLTKRFFAEPGLPPNLQRLRRRALSSTYVRAVDYLQVNQPRHWLWAVRLLAQAMITDPLNIRAISERTTRPFRERSMRLLSNILNIILTQMFGIGKRLLRLIAALMGALRLSLGRVVERVFVRGNRELTLKIDNLQQRVAAAEQAALEPVASRVDGIATDVLRLTDGLESLRRQDEAEIAELEDRIAQGRSAVLDAVESLRRQDEVRIAGLEDRITQDRSTVVDALESLRSEHEVRIAGLEDRITQDRLGIVDALESLRLQHEALRKDLEVAHERPPKVSDVLSEVYGTPPTLQPIPGWHTYWGVENGSNRFLVARNELWSSLKRPVLMRWLGDLLVMIWPGNELSRVLFLTGNFEPNELTWMSQTLAEGMTMIDIGAHMGMYTMTASKLVGESGVVVALEPSTREFQRLTFHVNLNDLRNVRCLQVAGSSVSGEATLKIASEWNSGHNTIGEFFNPEVETIREERVLTQTLDAVVSAQNLERVDLIKIDVEGHEMQVLAGAVETLTRFRPSLLIEVFEETLRPQGASVEAVLEFLTGHGYVLNEFSDVDGSLVPLSRSLSDESRNLVALPG